MNTSLFSSEDNDIELETENDITELFYGLGKEEFSVGRRNEYAHDTLRFRANDEIDFEELQELLTEHQYSVLHNPLNGVLRGKVYYWDEKADYWIKAIKSSNQILLAHNYSKRDDIDEPNTDGLITLATIIAEEYNGLRLIPHENTTK